MEAAAHIRKGSPALKSQDFAFLREEGMAWLRQMANETWSDHNLHDPGITMLEALAYALTEMGLRADMPLPDLIASDTSGYTQPFYTAAEILPAAPLTPQDFRKILIDHALVHNAWIYTRNAEPAGQYDVLIEFAEEALNTNTFDIAVTPPALTDTYHVDVAFPYWDEEAVQPFLENVTFLTVTFEGAPGNEWKPIADSSAYFARMTVDYQPTIGGPQSVQLWLVAQITTPVNNPTTNVPHILNAVTTDLSNLVGDHWLGAFNARVIAAWEQIRIIRRYLKDYRNLCETFLYFRPARLQEVAVSAIIDVNPGVALENLLAEIFLRLYQFISPDVTFTHLGSELEQNSSDAVLNGPLLQSGYLSETAVAASTQHTTLYTSDMLRLILQLRGNEESDVTRREDVSTRNIVAVRNLTLTNYLDNRRITSNARDCLHLVESRRHINRLSLQKSHISFYRDGINVTYSLDQVIKVFHEKLDALHTPIDTTLTDLPFPSGEAYEAETYYPVQNDLPLTYGVGEAGLPESATTARQAQARQLKGYLMLFEQLIAGTASQLTHFNELFSTSTAVTQTLFQQPLYQVPQVMDLLRGFQPALETWTQFKDNTDNPYVTLLRNASETRAQFLMRRHAILDHLLATFGEDLREREALVYRQAAHVANADSLSATALAAAQQQQYEQAATQMLHEKASWIDDLPTLHRDRAQAYGNPAMRSRQVFQTHASGVHTVRWTVYDMNQTALLQTSILPTNPVQAQYQAAAALSLGTVADHYYAIPADGGLFRLALQSSATAIPVTETVTTYANNAQAMAAIPTIRQAVLDLWHAHSVAPVERRLYHMLGMAVQQRRPLIHALATYFEIYDDTPNPSFEKRFRLWAGPGFTGAVLLESEHHYPGTTDPESIALAEAAIETVLQRGMVTAHYVIEQPTANIFQAVLLAEDGSALARSGDFTSTTLAQEALTEIQQHLYYWYSADGFYMIEHPRLYPPTETDTALVINGTTDPYAFQVTFILPSGYARNFAGTERRLYAPHKNSDPEYRRYAVLQIRKACPAHILPHILWVDRADPNFATLPDAPSFDNLETRYRTWHAASVIDEADESTLGTPRNELTALLNTLHANPSTP